jgi:hypothetical protein
VSLRQKVSRTFKPSGTAGEIRLQVFRTFYSHFRTPGGKPRAGADKLGSGDKPKNHNDYRIRDGRLL